MSLTNVSAGLSEVWGGDTDELDARMAAPHSPREALAALAAAICNRSADASGPDPIPTQVVRRIVAGGPCTMGMFTSALAIAESQLQRCEVAGVDVRRLTVRGGDRCQAAQPAPGCPAR